MRSPTSSRIVPRTDGFAGAKLRQLCDEAKRIAIKRTGFTKAAAPTVEDMLAALAAERTEQSPPIRPA